MMTMRLLRISKRKRPDVPKKLKKSSSETTASQGTIMTYRVLRVRITADTSPSPIIMLQLI